MVFLFTVQVIRLRRKNLFGSGSSMGPCFCRLRGFPLAYFSYHAFVWYVVHAVGWGHGGENIDAAVDVFLP